MKDAPFAMRNPTRPVTKIPVTVLSGFLGSGKTTTINHIIETKRAQRVAIIVNDIAEVNIDGKQIGDKILETEEKLVELENGCLCCTLRGDLFDETLALALEGKYDYLIIIHREIKRNFWADDALPKKYAGYFGHAAQLRTDKRRSVQRKLIRHPELCKTVIARIKQGWTPEQIGNRMIFEGAKLRVCQETIYRNIYSKEGMDQELWWYLPEHRKARRPRRARKRLPPKFDRDVSILFRPDDVAHRRQFGHWEGDLMLFKQKLGPSNVTSLVERVSRFTVLLKNPNKRTKPVMGKIMKAVRDLPHIARRSITFDRGTEFVSWPHLQAEIVTQTWFCDPSSPWQKGTVENTNRRARRWLPRKRDITAVSDHELKMICDRLNATPRKCLGWKSPAEVFREKMMEEMGRSPYLRKQ